MKRRVLVTGAGGLIGGRVVELLRADSEPIALSRSVGALPHDVEVISVDLCDPGFVSRLPERADSVIHLAQAGGYAAFPEGAQSMFDVNVAALAKLLDWAAKANVTHFVHASTGGLYGRGPHPFNEGDHVSLAGPLAFYFGTKRAAEILAAPYASKFGVAALRFFFVYGPGQKPTMLIPRLLKAVEQGQPVSLSGTQGMRLNPIYVDDAAAATIAALNLEGDSIINVAGGEVLSIRDIAETIGGVLGKRTQFKPLEAPEDSDLIADISRMRLLLHQPKISFREGVAQLARVACE